MGKPNPEPALFGDRSDWTTGGPDNGNEWRKLCAAPHLYPLRSLSGGPSRPPKGPFRTKNTTTIEKIVNYYAVVFLLRPPNLLRRGPFFERKNVCNSQENGVRTRCAAIVNHPAVLKILRVVNLLRVVFLVRRGPLGTSQIFQKYLSDDFSCIVTSFPRAKFV